MNTYRLIVIVVLDVLLCFVIGNEIKSQRHHKQIMDALSRIESNIAEGK